MECARAAGLEAHRDGLIVGNIAASSSHLLIVTAAHPPNCGNLTSYQVSEVVPRSLREWNNWHGEGRGGGRKA